MKAHKQRRCVCEVLLDHFGLSRVPFLSIKFDINAVFTNAIGPTLYHTYQRSTLVSYSCRAYDRQLLAPERAPSDQCGGRSTDPR